MVFLYILILLALAVIEGKPLARDKSWAELAVFSFFMVTGTALIAMCELIDKGYNVLAIVDFIFQPYVSLIRNILTGF